MRIIHHIPRYALMGGFTALDFMMRVRAGESVPKAAVTALGTLAVWQFAGGPLSAYFLGQLGMAVAMPAMSAYRVRKAQMRSLLYPRLGRGFQDTEQAYTLRQAALQAINRSYMNARFYLGQEASFLHS